MRGLNQSFTVIVSPLVCALAFTAGLPAPGIAAEGQAPGRRAAAQRIESALAGKNTRQALSAYEQFIAQTGNEDLPLLATIARAELLELSRSDAPDVRVEAIESLARAGDRQARQSLTGQTAASGDVPALQAAARSGDRTAVSRLNGLAEAGPPNIRVAAIQALGEVGDGGSLPTLARLLADPEILPRATAAAALGTLGDATAVDTLRPALDDPSVLVRVSAAASLKRLGDAGGDAVLSEALQSEAPDLRLVAAKGLAAAADPSWVPALLPLLHDRDGLTYLYAAELLLPEDPDALAVLGEAVQDPNPVVQKEAARILTTAARGPVSTLRQMLRADSPAVRVRGAGAIALRARAVAR
ncbi:MAG: HEAT repeat domain-containing protein [Acidobacteria bacterium]|nr:HEAT repeat domain-containing protein [Acidobacteriota bacterium]